MRVLIVEDEALLALQLEGLVEDEGHVVVGWAMSSIEAIRLAAETRPDLAFVDVHLSDGPTGIDVAREVRRASDTTVVFMTANAKRIPDDYAGAAGVIAKPYTMQGVTAALRYLDQGVTTPPPRLRLPNSFRLAPDYAERWKES